MPEPLKPPSLEELRALRAPCGTSTPSTPSTWGRSIAWLGWNAFGPKAQRFDPDPAFVLWLFISNMIQIFLRPLIMVGQNLQSRHSEARAQSDYEVNLQTEREIEAILLHLEVQAAKIETILAGLARSTSA